MELPPLTALQWFLLNSLAAADRRGAELRAALTRLGQRTTLAAFYQLMARLEEAGFVEGRYLQQRIDGVSLRLRCYAITARGRQAWERTRAFYVREGAPA